MINKENINSCEEFYVLEKTIHVVVNIAGELKTIRIEALRSLPHSKYSIRAYISEKITVQPTYPKTREKFDQKPKDMMVWINYYTLPWVDTESADAALNQALGFLLRSH